MNQMLQGQVALVTGGGRGIGRALAEKFASEGAAVMVVSRNEQQLSEVVAAIENAGGRAAKMHCDVTDRDSVNAVVVETEKTFGPITFLINNAGQAGPFGPIGVVDVDEWWQAQAVHVRGPMLFMSAVLPGMKQRKNGRVLNISSIGGVLKPEFGISAYGVGKCAQIRLSEYADKECRADGVRVFAVHPGTIITDMARNTQQDADAQRWLPWFVDMLQHVTQEQSDKELQACINYATQIAAGKYDILAGRYLDLTTDLDQVVKEVEKELATTAE